MRFCKAALVAAVLGVALSASPSNAWHVYAPVAAPVARTPAGPGVAGGGGGAGPGAAIIGGFIAGVTIAIIVHEILGPACARKTKYNVAHGYDQPRFWRPLCKVKRDPKPIAVRW